MQKEMSPVWLIWDIVRRRAVFSFGKRLVLRFFIKGGLVEGKP